VDQKKVGGITTFKPSPSISHKSETSASGGVEAKVEIVRNNEMSEIPYCDFLKDLV